MKHGKRSYIITFSILFLILIVNYFFDDQFTDYSLKSECFQGTVIRKFLDTANHLGRKVELEGSNEKYVQIIETNSLFVNITVGDYIIKEKGSFVCKLIKNKTDTSVYYIDHNAIKVK